MQFHSGCPFSLSNARFSPQYITVSMHSVRCDTFCAIHSMGSLPFARRPPLGAQWQLSQQALLCHPAIPFLPMIGTITNPASGFAPTPESEKRIKQKATEQGS
jgi:hypothetical protein